MLAIEVSSSGQAHPLFPNPQNESHQENFHFDCEFIEGLPASEAHRRALSARKLLGCASRTLALWLIEIDKRKLYLEYSCSSVYQYASLHLNIEGHAVSEYLRTGKALQNLPSLSRAYENGEISSSKVREITRVAIPETDSFWTESAKGCTTREIEKMVVYTPKGGLPFQEEPVRIEPERTETERTASPVDKARDMAGAEKCGEETKENNGGISHNAIEEGKRIRYNDKLIVELSGDQMAVVKDALDKARRESAFKDRAALLVYMARTFLEGTAEVGGKGTRPPYQIVLHTHPGSGITWTESANGERYISSPTLEKALCDAEIIDIREEGEREGADSTISTPDKKGAEGRSVTGDSSPTVGQHAHSHNKLLDHINALYASHKKRKGSCNCKDHIPKIARSAHYLKTHSIPPSLRKKIMLRDQCACQAPGCGRKVFLSIHHIIPLGAGGDNVEPNLLTLCSGCHSLVHEGKLDLSGKAPSNLVWRDMEGRILK